MRDTIIMEVNGQRSLDIQAKIMGVTYMQVPPLVSFLFEVHLQMLVGFVSVFGGTEESVHKAHPSM